MNIALLLFLALAPSSSFAPPHTSAPAQEVDVRAKFVELHAKNDEAGCEKLFREHPGDVLGTIDADLEGSLGIWEKNPAAPEVGAINDLHTRALWGARIATRVSGDPIFLDYASSFVGWNEQQKKKFRGGQDAYRKARAALKAKDWAAAASAARECVELAAPLGDWWGQAMGLGALGQVLIAEGKHPDAIAPLAQAALIYRELQLTGDEYGMQRTLVTALLATGATQRAHAALVRAKQLAEVLGDTKGAAELASQMAELEARLRAAK